MNPKLYLFACLFILATASISAQSSQTFTDKSGTQIELEVNEMAFVEEATSKRKLRHFQSDPQNLVGPPNAGKGMKWPNRKMMSLGCRGSVKAVFNSVGFFDGPGADLVIFEGGSVFEPTNISISSDGINWVRLGTIEGGNAAIDIKHPDTEGKLFHYVLLRDRGSHCVYSKTDGADIDAIAAINYKKVAQENVVVTSIIKDKTETAKKTNLDVSLTTPEVDFTVFPNPTSAELNIKFNLEEDAEISIRIFNQAGKVIKDILSSETRVAGDQIINYSLGSLAAGTYYVQLMVEDRSVVKKLVKN